MRSTLLALSSLLTTLHALTITSPAAGSTVDPSQPIVVQWTSTSSDPATFNLVFAGPSGSTYLVKSLTSMSSANNQLATNILASSGSFTIPANTVSGFGSDFSIAAVTSVGDSLATAGNLVLAYGSGQVVTESDGQASLASSTSLSSITFDTAGATGMVTATYLPSTDLTNATPTMDSTRGSVRPFTTKGPPASFSPTISQTGATSASEAGASGSTPTTNAQARVGMGKEVLSAAGILAGFVALIV